ncbi:MAG TPA: ABC transporter permease [Micromonosporaceae bacterium]|nr:ABC transporter permease [Micromonosporaceae bacterium]
MNALTGTGKLIRLILRRDRWLLAVWVLPISLVPQSLKSTISAAYPTPEELRGYYDVSVDNPGFISLYGQLPGPSLGEMVAWRIGFVPVMVGLIALLTVIRHTRTEEETGRRELVGATVVGRHAGLAAALTVTFVANLVLAVLVALFLIGQGMPAAGSWALGLELAAAGWVFAAVGAVAAQLTESAGAARAIAITALGVAYLLRVVGDLSSLGNGAVSWLSWLSPIGWVHRIRPYGAEQWWVLALAAGFTAVLTVGAVALAARRDVGAGLLPTRPGPAAAAPGLNSPLGLAWRLHRSLLAGWLVGFAVLGLVFGGVAESIGDLLNDNQGLQDVFARIGGRAALIDIYFAAIMSLIGIIAAGYAIQAALRLRTEESSLRAEPILATSVSRLRWAASHYAFSVLGPAAAMVTAGLVAGLAYGISTGDAGREVPRVLGAAMVQLPAVWVLSAVAIALVGLLPRMAATGGWGALALCLMISMIGAPLQLSQWLLDVSPFTHVPRAPGADVSAAPLVWLLVVAVALTAAGLAGLRRRDISP